MLARDNLCFICDHRGAQNPLGPAGFVIGAKNRRLLDYVEHLVLFLVHPVERRHTCGDVSGDMAMVHPLARLSATLSAWATKLIGIMGYSPGIDIFLSACNFGPG